MTLAISIHFNQKEDNKMNRIISRLFSRFVVVLTLAFGFVFTASGDNKTDVMFAKGFGSYTTNSFSAAGTDRTSVANSTNSTGVTYAMQVFNGSTGAVRGNQSGAANYSCRNTTTYDGYYVSSVSLTVSGGTIDGSTAGRSVVHFGSSAYGNPNSSAPSGSYTSASPASSGQATLTWTNSNEDNSYFILYNLKTAGTALSANASTSLTVVWTKKTAGPSAVGTTTTINASGINNTDVYTGTEAGSLSASVTVTEGGAAVPEASVTWSGNNDEVATINANTGAVTLVSAGSVTFTATYAGRSGEYLGSSDTYEMTVTSSAPYVQPTEISITPNYTFWGKDALFSGSTYDSLSGSKDNVSLAWSSGTGSTYANTTAMRFYKDNELTFTAPSGYKIKSIVIAGTLQGDEVFSPAGFDNSTWTGASETVTMSRPSNGSSYSTISGFTITIGLPSSIATPTFSPAAGTYLSSQTVTISCETDGTTIYYTTDGTTPSESNGTEGNSVTISSTTTLKAVAVKGGESSEIAVAEYTFPTVYTDIPTLFSAATDSSTPVYVTFGDWVVSGVNGNQVFITDGSNGLIVYQSGHGFEVGNTLSGTVSCNLVLYNGAAEITGLTSSTEGLTVVTGGSVSPVTTSIGALSAVNTGSVVTLNNLTYNGSALSDGVNSITPGNSLYNEMALVSDKQYNVTGVFVVNNTTKRILPRSAADIVEVVVPSISLSSTSIEATASETEGTITVTCNNMTGDVMLDVYFYEADGTTPATYSWIDADINGANNVEFLISANDGSARTAYFKVYGIDEASHEVYSALVTITQAAYVIDYATLPFEEYTGNGTGDLPAGLTVSGTGTYNSNPKIKFEGGNDSVILKINESPTTYTLAFDIKGNASGTAPATGVFKLQTSEDGVSYTDLKTYTSISSDISSERFDNLGEGVRYIKWIHVTKTTGNVALGNISLTRPDQSPSINITGTLSGGHYWATFFNSAACYTLSSGAKAYTMNSADHQLYLLGDGDIIPANTAVVIISDVAAITLTKDSDTAVPVSGTDNILHGSNYGVRVSDIPAGTPYVLGIPDAKPLGFYQFTGAEIPANKAYYVE